jgi:hypothetical protein
VEEQQEVRVLALLAQLVELVELAVVVVVLVAVEELQQLEEGPTQQQVELVLELKLEQQLFVEAEVVQLPFLETSASKVLQQLVEVLVVALVKLVELQLAHSFVQLVQLESPV